jgi:hypothetical protein
LVIVLFVFCLLVIVLFVLFLLVIVLFKGQTIQ